MTSLFNRSLVWLLIIQYAQGSSFSPICTVPPPNTNYVSGPSLRGTTTILWNCLSIILLCTWNIQHLNIPAERSHTKSRMKALWWVVIDSRKKIKWMLFTVLIPEYLVGKAFGERLGAKTGAIVIKCAAPDFEWEEIHAYLANMGYFVVDFRDLLVDKQVPFNSLADHAESKNYDLLGRANYKMNLSRLRHHCWALNNRQLHYAIEQGLIDIPKITSPQLAKLDREDTLAKVLALFQIIYLIVQLIARKVANLPSTQLEIATLAFSASSIITYILYWPRPQGVEIRHVIRAKILPSSDHLATIAHRGPVYLWTYARGKIRVDESLDLVPLPNDGSDMTYLATGIDLLEVINNAIDSNYEVIPLAFGAVFSGTIFGGLHCLAWNFQFPTPGEALSWKVCSILTTCLPILIILPFILLLRLVNYPRELLNKIQSITQLFTGFILITMLVSYILARLFLMAEIFRSLFFLPPEAFVDTWSGSFPHFG